MSEPIVHELTLLGDLIKVTVDSLKQMDRPWVNLSEEEQNRIIGNVTHTMRQAVREACVIIDDSVDKIRIRAQVDSITIKDGIKAVLKVDANNDGRHALSDSSGEYVDIIICRIGDLLHEGGAPTADPQQSAMELNGDE